MWANHKQINIVVGSGVCVCGCGSTLLKSYWTNGSLSILENSVLNINEPRRLTFDNGAKWKANTREFN